VTLPFPGSYDEPHSTPSSDALAPLETGLPSAWWPTVGGLASLVFSAFWLTESWEDAGPLLGPTKVNHLTQGLAGLLAALVCPYAMYRFWKHRSETLGLVLGLLTAAIAMTWHRL